MPRSLEPMERTADAAGPIVDPSGGEGIGGAHRAEIAVPHEMQAPSRELYVERFDGYSRFLHVLVIVSFLSLAVTGMVIKFSEVSAFQLLARVLGGYQVTGFIHRVAALVTFLYFGLHLRYLFAKKRRQGLRWKDLLTGEDTLVPRWRDVVEFGQTVRWFVGRGPRPQYGRWTYWEKFDYFAVFWGVAIIGASGLILWFPEFFTALGMPGWMINVATIIHSDEALLATGFIFTVHFFNTHFRPDKFPMDTVIFTGSVPLEELKHERPRAYRQLLESGALEEKLVAPPPRWMVRAARLFGLTALSIGILIVGLIIYSIVVSF